MQYIILRGHILYRTGQAAIDEFVHGGHATALILPCVVLAFGLARGDQVDLLLLAIAYLIPLVIYAYDYYRELDRDRLAQPERAGYLGKKAGVYPYLICGYVALLAALVILYNRYLIELFAIVSILLAAGILYTICLKRVTKHVPGFKSYYVAAVWVLAIAPVYVIYSGREPDIFLLAVSCLMFVKLVASGIFYDLRDIRADARDGLKTIPVVLGWRRTVRLLFLLSLLSLAPLIAGAIAGAVPGAALVLIAFLAYETYYLRLAEVGGEKGMTAKRYAIADFEFVLWPAAVAACLWLLDGYGPEVTGIIVVLAVAGGIMLAWLMVKPPVRRKPRGDAPESTRAQA